MAQLSPGDLLQGHSHLEGISNCTQCHDLGNKVLDSKCLDCHTEIDELMDAGRGFHASDEVRKQECADCHSDHHGRKFDAVRFDQDNFDHDLTGYELEGEHGRIDCRECHNPEYIADAEIRKRKDTFLGMGTECLDCHDDYHQGTLDNDCTQCHNIEEWAPAEYFDHDNTDYPLEGAHVDVDCIECHPVVMRQGLEFQRFADIEYTNCTSCHDDVHDNNLGTDCKQCHTEESFTSHRRLKRFRHDRTNFPLKGQHKRVDCFACHTDDVALDRLFQENLGTDPNDCASCHEDVHEGKLGTNCIECHNEESWTLSSGVMSEDEFNHDLTDFPLEGKHETVDCRECHVSERFTEPMAHQNCADCHDDYHQGEFADAVTGIAPDCVDCHTVDGFTPSTFTLEAHAETNFPLDGAHVATPCFACHYSEEPLAGDVRNWRFREIGSACVDCHEDVHEGEIADEFYPEQACEICHTTNTWLSENLFDHGVTPFTLEGAHLSADCVACHERNDEFPYGQFADLSSDCMACHENIHREQFEIDGVTDCRRCHGFDDWEAIGFNHDETEFPLEGKHAEVDCAECHKPTFVDGEPVVYYQMESFECVDCHQ